MTVQELIDELQKVEDKSLRVYLPNSYTENRDELKIVVKVDNYFCSPKQFVDITYGQTN